MHRGLLEILTRSRRSQTISELLERDPVCREIVAYLAQHTDAADTARGIAEWWIGRDIVVTEAALEKLLAQRLVTAHLAGGAASVYRFTRNPRDRQIIGDCLNLRLLSPGADRH